VLWLLLATGVLFLSVIPVFLWRARHPCVVLKNDTGVLLHAVTLSLDRYGREPAWAPAELEVGSSMNVVAKRPLDEFRIRAVG
jgi:hypothetical protein